LITVDLDSIKPCWDGFNLDFKKVRNVVTYHKFKTFGKITENICGSIISNRGSFPFLKKHGQ
jgi:hypothetical protein